MRLTKFFVSSSVQLLVVMKRYTLFSLLFLLVPLSCFGSIQFFAGSEFFHMKRTRQSGTWQSGRIDGTRITLHRLSPYAFYLAADYLYAGGVLKGKDSRMRPIRSELTDNIFEARLGYCLWQKEAKRALFVPFGGWGYFKEKNNLTHPTPFPYKSTDQFDYMVFGFLSSFRPFSCLEVGLNFKMMFMREATSKIRDPDPSFADITLMIRDVPYFRIELPLLWHTCQLVDFRLSPFYEYRHFGGREGYPFDFIDTTFDLFGLTISLVFTY